MSLGIYLETVKYYDQLVDSDIKICICTVGLKTFKKHEFSKMESHTYPMELTISMVFSESMISVSPAMRNLKNFTRSDGEASSYDMISRSSFAGGYGDGSDTGLSTGGAEPLPETCLWILAL